MKLIERLRQRRARRRGERAVRAEEQAELRRELEADDKSLVEAAHPPIPPGWGSGGSGF